MKIISIFCIILCVTSFVNALDDSLYMYFDLEGILEGYETRLPIMEKGKFNSQVANFANSIAIPANVSQCSLIWFTIPNAGTTYKATVIANEPEKLGVLLSEPVKGIVSDHEKKYIICV